MARVLSSKKLDEKLKAVYDTLLETYGPQVCFLHHQNPFELLIAVILSAQCTDKTVNANTPALFKKFPDAATLAKATPEEVEPFVRAIGLYKAKTRYIIGTAQKLVDDYNGEVPASLDALIEFPGVGRKTANVLMSDVFGQPGFAVDTHVKRLTNRIGLTVSDSPEVIESEIVSTFPMPPKLGSLSHLLIVHGRECCTARTPHCERCVIAPLCARKFKPKD